MDGGALFANQMLKEDKTKSYAKEIANFLDDLIANGFEYKYDSPEIKPVEGNSGSYVVVFPNFEIYLKKDWLSSLSKYRDKLSDEMIFNDAIKLYIKSRLYRECIGFVFELKDVSGNIIAQKDVGFSVVDDDVALSRVLGLYSDSHFRYPNISDEAREITISRTPVIGALDSSSIAKINKIIIYSVKVKNYGGKLPLYKGNGVFE